MQNNLVMTSSPHLRDHSSTQRIMQEVCLALLPAGIAGVIIFGWSALMLICVSVTTCVLSEFVWEKQQQFPKNEIFIFSEQEILLR